MFGSSSGRGAPPIRTVFWRRCAAPIVALLNLLGISVDLVFGARHRCGIVVSLTPFAVALLVLHSTETHY